MVLFILKPKFTHSMDFCKCVNKEAVHFSTEQVIFFFIVVFCPMILDIHFKRYYTFFLSNQVAKGLTLKMV